MALPRWLVLTAAISMQLLPGTSAADDTPSFVRLKPVDAEMRRLMVAGYQRSATFRRLVDEIHGSRALVVVQFGSCGRGRYRACVSHIGGDARQRSLRIKVSPQTTTDRLIATIAHELQHALEIAGAPDVVTAGHVVALYRRIGVGECRDGLSEACETNEALETERRVLAELYDRDRR